MDYATENTSGYAKASAVGGMIGMKAMLAPENRRATPLDEATSRMRDLITGMSTLRVRLDDNADRVFGHRTPTLDGCEASPLSTLSTPPLMDTLLSVLSHVEREFQELSAAADRNCWAV